MLEQDAAALSHPAADSHVPEANFGDNADAAPILDDDGLAMIVNSHHYTADNIREAIAQLKAFADPQETTQADWDNLDWRGFCNVLWRLMAGLACDLPPAAAKDAEGSGEAVGYLNDWPDEPELGDYFSHDPCEGARSRPLYTTPPASQPQALVPLTVEQRADVFRAAERRMVGDLNLSWRNAVIGEVERAHGINGLEVKT